uniref:IQCH-like ATP-grasp domain-containing protein n=1 Tax=Ciona intestinalis TaxID=7719 RepID=F6WN68_CIOIN
MAEVQRRPENVGRILVQVQEDLHNLKEQMSAMKLEGSNQIDLKSIDDALMRTEQGLKVHQNAEYVVSMMNNQVMTLPTVDEGSRRSSRPRASMQKMRESSGRPQLHPSLFHDSPGENFQHNLTMKALLNPENLNNREVLHRNYNFTLPAIKPPRQAKLINQSVTRGCTVDQLSVLPRANRTDPSLPPPSIMEKDAKKGILSLIERGLIPPAAELTLDPSPVHHKRARLHNAEEATRKQLQSESSARVKPYITTLGTSEGAMTASVPPSSANYSRSAGSPQLRSVLIQSPTSRKKSGQGYSFFITSGNLPRSGDPEFSAFHQRYLLQWGSVITMVAKLQKVLQDYAIPTAYVNGDRLAELSRHYELEYQPTRDELLTVLENYEDVLAMISTPGRRFLGTDGRYIAVSKIQATWRRYRDRRAYLQYRKQRWAAGVIAISWIMHVRMSRMRKRLRHIRRSHLDNYRARGKTLALEWNRITSSRRVIVHVPSLGHPTQIRFGMSGFDRKQNAQMARLCDLIDTNVEVIYVSPVEVLEELQQYYCKLLGLKGAVEEADPEKVGDLSTRFTIVTPEALNKFPTHHMCLASLLKYSPCALSRIKKLIAGRDAYYVPGVIHKDDISVADELNIPILGCEPEICHLYSSKSGGRRVFAAADATAPPGDHDVYSAQQLHESMARLICENPYVTKWLMKIDSGFDGRSIAYIEVNKHLPCYLWMLRESRRYGDKWSKKWAQDAAYTKVLCELPDALDNFACPANKDVFPTWVDFLDAFLGQGGIIEAYPPTESVTCLTIDMLIDPTGKMHMTSCGDQIHAENTFRCWGTSVPQASVEPAVLNDVSMRIAEACRARGVIGYFSIDYVTFIDPVTYKQTLWATDLTLAYSDQMAMTQMLLFVTGGKLDAAEGRLVVPPPPKPKQARFRKRDDDKDKLPPPNLTRFSVMSTNLVHTNMAVVHYSVFFQMCRAHGIGFDIKERQGTVFTLVDSSKREELGMLSVGEDLPSALASFARNLTVIHQEISAPNMQGRTNFKAAVDDIEIILGTTAQNEKEDEKENKNLSA